MSDKIGNLSYYDSSGQGEYSFNKPYSEKTAETIDEEVKDLIDIQYKRAKDILAKNKKGLQELADILLEKEVIFSDDLEKIFGKRPWVSEDLVPTRAELTTKPKAKTTPKAKPKAVAQDSEVKEAMEEKTEVKKAEVKKAETGKEADSATEEKS